MTDPSCQFFFHLAQTSLTFLYRESCERALEIYVKIYGHKHPSVAAVLASLGNNWKHTGDKDKAITNYQKALTIQEEIYGPNHLEVSYNIL